jgi:hypothetical protein
MFECFVETVPTLAATAIVAGRFTVVELVASERWITNV